MDALILGLLMLQRLTVYEIRAFLGQGMYLMYSDSMGSIQAAIKKLLEREYVFFDEHIEKGKNKKTYSITGAGKKYFENWLAQPIEPNTAQSRVLTKLFFMGMLAQEQREPLIANYIVILQQKLDTLEASLYKAERAVFDDGLRDIAFFQTETIRLSIASVQSEMSWYEGLIDRMSGGEGKE